MNVDGLPSIGDTVVGKYQLIRELGRGGMGAVYEAMHLRLGQKVAIKVVLPGVASQPELAYRFEHEARAAARLKGRHTARVFDVDTSPEGLRFLVMELLNGHSLRDEIAQRGPLPLEDAVRYLREACEGVDEAHQAGIIHRDIKPANLFLSKEGGVVVVKVVDFGIAKASDPTDDKYHTATNVPLGTYKYMSPEQAKAPRSVDGRTDVWSLGVVLYQLLTGKVPFDGDGAFSVLYAIAAEEPTPLLSLRPDVPAELAALVARALCKNLEGRIQTVRELSDALAPFDAVRAPLPSRPSALALPSASAGSAGERASQPALTPALAHTAPAPAPGPAAEALNESVTSATQSQIVPIKTEPAARSSLLWLVGAAITLAAGGITAGIRSARSNADATPVLPASASVPAGDARAEKVVPDKIAPAEKATPVGSGPSLKAAADTATAPQVVPLIEPGNGGAASAQGASAMPAASDEKASARASSAPAGRPAPKARPGQPSRDKPGGDPAPKPAAPTSPKPPEPAERAVPEVL